MTANADLVAEEALAGIEGIAMVDTDGVTLEKAKKAVLPENLLLHSVVASAEDVVLHPHRAGGEVT